MTEFTELMNQRVNRFLLMFKELRSGNISYPEIAKRENVRLPINRVCQMLGVKSVDEMISDDSLLQAIQSIVHEAEMKRQSKNGEDCNEGEDDDGDLYDDEPAVTIAKLTEINTNLSHSNDSSNQSPLTSPVTSPTLNSRKLSFRVIPRNSAEFLTVALAVRSSNGRIQKALQQAQQRPEASAELLAMTGADLQSLVKALCGLIGCKRLDSSVPQDAVAQAVEQFILQNQPSASVSSSEVKTTLILENTDASAASECPAVDANTAPMPQSTDTLESSTSLCIETPEEAPSPVTSHLGTSFSPSQRGHNGYYNQFAPQEVASQCGSARSPSAEVPPPAQSHAVTPRAPLSLDEVYQQFWELAYRLFLYVCNPYRHCHECLCVVEDLVLLLESCAELRSPLPALALDSVIQRAMYELSDKVSRPLDPATLLALQNYRAETQSQISGDAAAGSADAANNTAHSANTDKTGSPAPLPVVIAPDCSVRNIEMCIALMSRNVSPICAKIRDDYYTAHGLPVPPAGQNWCEKVLTLTRQLQELIAWSSPHCQARVPAYVPVRRHSQSALAAKDTLFTDRSLSDSNLLPNAPQGAAVGPLVPPEPKVIDFLSTLSPNTANEVTSTLKLKDAALCEVLRQMGAQSVYAKMPHDLESSIQLNLHKVIHQSISSDCSIVLTGAAVLGLSDAHNKIKLDYVALAAPYHTNYHDLSLDEQRADLAKFGEIQESLKELERAVETDKLTEIAWKHLKACARDFHTQSQDYIIKLTSNNNNGGNAMDAQQQYGGRGYNAHNNANMNPYEPYSSHNNNNHYHNKYVLQPPQYNSNFNNNSQYPGSPGNSTLPPELILEIAEDAEKMRKIGDNLVEKYFSLRLERTAQAPVVNQILRKMEEVQENNEKNERERMNFVRKFSKSLDRVLKDNRYLYVRMVSNKARFTHINFEQHVNPHVQVSVNVIGCNPLPVQMTELVQDYINLDTTNKVRDFLQTVKLFASSHHISDPASGYLSSTAWYVMALHVLLKHNLLPNLHHTRLYGAQKTKDSVTPVSSPGATTAVGNTTNSANSNNINNNTSLSLSARTLTPRAAYTPHTLPSEYRDRLHATSLLVMLDLFFRYYVEQMNLFTSVVTLREQGLLLPKTDWPANPVLWRVSIEDPFEAIGSPKPYDLGSTLSRPGQLTTFKALRRAVYGIHSIMADSSNECHENISRLFSRVELINLARQSDYMGAVITASPAWVRPKDTSILDSPQYTAYTTALCKKYETPEVLHTMFPALLSPRDGSTSNSNSSVGQMSPALLQHKAMMGNPTAGGSLSARASEFQPSWMSASGSSAPSSARSAASSTIKASPPMHQQHGQQLSQYPPNQQQSMQQGYKQAQGYPAANAAGGSYTYGQAGAGSAASGPLKTPGLQLTQHPQAHSYQQHQQNTAAGVGQGRMDPRDPRNRQGYTQGPSIPSGQNQSQGHGQYRDDPQMSYVNQQQIQGQQMPPQRMPYQGGGTVNLNNRQVVPVIPAPQQQMQMQMQHQQSPPTNAGQKQQHVHVPRHILLQQKKMLQQQQSAPPFDAAAAALAAAAERRYPVNQIMPSQNFDPKNRNQIELNQRPQENSEHQRGSIQAAMLTTGAQQALQHQQQHQLQQKSPPQHVRQMQQQLPPPPQNRFHSSPPGREAARYGMLDERQMRSDPLLMAYGEDDRNHAGNLAPRGQEGGRYGADPRQGLVPQTARQESHRFPVDDVHPSGSMSARYASQEDRYATYGAAQAPPQRSQQQLQQEQHQQLQQQKQQQQEQLYQQQLRAPEPAPQRQSTGLPPSFKLDLQPRFAEDRYNYAPDSARSASVVSSAYPSARNPEDRTMPGPINIGNLSARRLSELTALNHSPRPGYADNNPLTSPRLLQQQHQQAQMQAQQTPLSLSLQTLQAQSFEHQKTQKKSPVVPLIPLEGISNFSGSSSSDYSNPLYSDRSSMYQSTGRSDGLADTGRSTIVANNNHLTSGGYGPPGSSRSTGTQQHLSQYPGQHGNHSNINGGGAYPQYSAPNTSRSVDFSLGPDMDSSEDYRQDYFGSGLGHHLTARSLEESLQLTDRSPASSDFANTSHVSDSLLTNRLGYMGLDDLRNTSKNDLGLPLSVVRPAQASLLPLSGEFDDIFTRLNKSSLSHSQSMSVSQGSGRAGSFINDLPLNSARSVNSANSGRASSSASNLIPTAESLDFGSHNNNNLFGSNNNNVSGGDLHSLYPARVPSFTPADLQGLLGLSNDAELYTKTAAVNGPGAYSGLYSSPNSSGSTDCSGYTAVGVVPTAEAPQPTMYE